MLEHYANRRVVLRRSLAAVVKTARETNPNPSPDHAGGVHHFADELVRDLLEEVLRDGTPE